MFLPVSREGRGAEIVSKISPHLLFWCAKPACTQYVNNLIMPLNCTTLILPFLFHSKKEKLVDIQISQRSDWVSLCQ